MGWKKFPDISKDIREKAEKDLDEIHAEFLDALLTGLPTENGHAHEAYLSGLSQAPQTHSTETSSVISKHASKASGDATAASAGTGEYFDQGDRIGVHIDPGLPFIDKLISGGTIKKIGHGHKGHGIKGPGPLYSPRAASGPSGWLMWYDESGKQHFAQTRPVPESPFMKEAHSKANSAASRLGWKEI